MAAHNPRLTLSKNTNATNRIASNKKSDPIVSARNDAR
jgi:hypothetical protein